MSLYAGLDISVKTTAICVVDRDGRVLLEAMVDSAPEAIAERLRELGQPFERIGLEAGPLSQWIYGGLVDAGVAAICVETRHMHAALSARINKTDRNHARGIAQMMRVGLFKAVHVKPSVSQHRRLAPRIEKKFPFAASAKISLSSVSLRPLAAADHSRFPVPLAA